MANFPSRQPTDTDRRATGPDSAPGLRLLDVQRLPEHTDRLYRAAYALCGSREDAEDLVQATFERVLKRPRFLRRDHDAGYLLRVLRNTWINNYHERARRPITVELDLSTDDLVDPGADPAVSVVGLQAIYEAVGELSPPLRETLAAVDIVGLSYRQAARALGVKEGTIMSRLFRARKYVAERLDSDGLLSDDSAGSPGSLPTE